MEVRKVDNNLLEMWNEKSCQFSIPILPKYLSGRGWNIGIYRSDLKVIYNKKAKRWLSLNVLPCKRETANAIYGATVDVQDTPRVVFVPGSIAVYDSWNYQQLVAPFGVCVNITSEAYGSSKQRMNA